MKLNAAAPFSTSLAGKSKTKISSISLELPTIPPGQVVTRPFNYNRANCPVDLTLGSGA